MQRRILIVWVLLLCLYLPVFAFAETIVLNSGKIVEGKLIERTDKYIKIDFQGVGLIYYYDEIKSIDGVLTSIPKQSITIDILNPEYAKPPNMDDNVKITAESSGEDILRKMNYYYSTHDFESAIALGEATIKKTHDSNLIAAIHFSLSSNYLEKGISAYEKNNDDSFYSLSIQHAKKYLETDPQSWQALGNIGVVYMNMSDWKQAISYFLEAEKYMDKTSPNYESMALQRNLCEEMDKKN